MPAGASPGELVLALAESSRSAVSPFPIWRSAADGAGSAFNHAKMGPRNASILLVSHQCYYVSELLIGMQLNLDRDVRSQLGLRIFPSGFQLVVSQRLLAEDT